jgi:hypothetical protein
MKEDTAHGVRAKIVELFMILRTFGHNNQRMMVVNLD